MFLALGGIDCYGLVRSLEFDFRVEDVRGSFIFRCV